MTFFSFIFSLFLAVFFILSVQIARYYHFEEEKTISKIALKILNE